MIWPRARSVRSTERGERVTPGFFGSTPGPSSFNARYVAFQPLSALTAQRCRHAAAAAGRVARGIGCSARPGAAEAASAVQQQQQQQQEQQQSSAVAAAPKLRDSTRVGCWLAMPHSGGRSCTRRARGGLLRSRWSVVCAAHVCVLRALLCVLLCGCAVCALLCVRSVCACACCVCVCAPAVTRGVWTHVV